MNPKLRVDAENDYEEGVFKSINNYIFGKMMKNVRKPRDIKLVTTDK